MTVEPSIADYLLSAVIAVALYLFQARMAKGEECRRHLEMNQIHMADEFNKFRLDYVQKHGELTALAANADAKVAAMQLVIDRQLTTQQDILQTHARLRERVETLSSDIKWLKGRMDRIKFLQSHGVLDDDEPAEEGER